MLPLKLYGCGKKLVMQIKKFGKQVYLEFKEINQEHEEKNTAYPD